MLMRTILTGSAFLVACILLVASVATTAVASEGRTPDATDPLAVVEQFLLARDVGDAWGATAWCAPVLELHDVDGSGWVDPPTTSDWLRQLSDRYDIEQLSPLVAEGRVVSWTERLSRRSLEYPETRPSFSIEVRAVVRDGKIAYLSGPYPPIPLLRPS